MSRDVGRPRNEPASAAEWYVTLDSSAPDEVGAARFAAWLDRAEEHEHELERCEAAVAITRGLADDPELQWAYGEAAALATGRPVIRRTHARRIGWRFAWGAALTAAGLAGVAAVWLARDTHGPAPSTALGRTLTAFDTASSASTAERGASLAAAAATYPIVSLRSGIVVDAGSVAVLPFTFEADEGRATGRLAAMLSRGVGASLAAQPGIYVIASPQSSAYLGTELGASEVGDQLGVRGIVIGDVSAHEGQIRVAAQLLDAVTDQRLWHAEYEGPAADHVSLADEIGAEINAALIDPTLREHAVAAARSLRNARVDNHVTSVRPDFGTQ